MSISSYTNLYAKFPNSPDYDLTEWGRCATVKDGVVEIDAEYESHYTEDLLEDLIDVFKMPLDKVPGLELCVNYECDEDEYFRCSLHINDGKCRYEESEIHMVERPMSECPIALDYGLPDYEVRREWKRVKDTIDLLAEDGRLTTSFVFRTDEIHRYPKNTPVAEILHEFERLYGVSVIDMMYPTSKE